MGNRWLKEWMISICNDEGSFPIKGLPKEKSLQRFSATGFLHALMSAMRRYV